MTPGSSFFDLGGHSLLAARLAAAFRKSLHLSVPVAAIMLRPELSELADYVAGLQDAAPGTSAAAAAAAGTPVVDRAAAAEAAAAAMAPELKAAIEADVARVDSLVVPPSPFYMPRPQRVLVTGSTGHFGAHIVAHLLAEGNMTTFCLVRASSDAAARDRVLAALERRDLLGPLAASRATQRLVAVAGALQEERFGLTDAQWNALACELDMIVHCGAEVCTWLVVVVWLCLCLGACACVSVCLWLWLCRCDCASESL